MLLPASLAQLHMHSASALPHLGMAHWPVDMRFISASSIWLHPVAICFSLSSAVFDRLPRPCHRVVLCVHRLPPGLGLHVDRAWELSASILLSGLLWW